MMKFPLLRATLVTGACFAGLLLCGSAQALTLRSESIKLPESTRVFPGDGPGAHAANSYCLMCHSAGMVMTQPAFDKATWLAEVSKMKHVFKAPIPEDQLPVIADYLASIKDK